MLSLSGMPSSRADGRFVSLIRWLTASVSGHIVTLVEYGASLGSLRLDMGNSYSVALNPYK
jgi:hypothetical protein